ncbi:MAG: uracil-DNA glycosylase [Candidatus Omnitrophica bacterium]|nr:uracil-DNA glycosylase [Candidatus Omnitrophota bacterium]
MTPKEFVKALSSVEFDDVFNPYSNQCPIHDLPDAPKLRRKALLALLHAAVQTEIDSLWIGRDLGYRGGRRTGLALTDEMHMHSHAVRWHIVVKRVTNGTPVAERTAAVIWSVLALIKTPIFLWNVFPLHPHEPGDPFSNRSHNSREREAGESLLADLILMIQPRRLIAIGNEAMRAAQHVANSHEIIQVRHPSYGGQTVFLKQVKSLYDL